jgi:hypothetical protein
MQPAGRRPTASIAFLDFLFNLVLCFLSLVLLLIMQSKQDDVKVPDNRNEVIIKVSWNGGTDDDIDTWVLTPGDQVVSFISKEAPGIHLQRDDVGRKHKRIVGQDGQVTEITDNGEEVNITKIQPGTYTVNLHFFKVDQVRRVADPAEVVEVTVRVIKVNPYQELPAQTVRFTRADVGQEVTVINLQFGADGSLLGTSTLPRQFATVPRGDTVR